MGKNQKIPYIKEVIWYLVKVGALFAIVYYVFNLLGIYNFGIAAILVVFLALCLHPAYVSLLLVAYFAFLLVMRAVDNQAAEVLLNMIATLLNTMIVILFLKLRYHMKEEN